MMGSIKYFTQGRVFASGPDDAALKARDKHQEYDGGLTVFYVNQHGGGWWEYMIELTTIEEDEMEIKDSGHRREFETGAVRDMAEGKGRFDLIPPLALRRLAKHYEKGAIKYGDRNWEKGIPNDSFIDSALRHINQYQAGEENEDHLSAAVFNLFGIVHFEEVKKKSEQLPDAPTKDRRGCRCADGQLAAEPGDSELRELHDMGRCD